MRRVFSLHVRVTGKMERAPLRVSNARFCACWYGLLMHACILLSGKTNEGEIKVKWLSATVHSQRYSYYDRYDGNHRRGVHCETPFLFFFPWFRMIRIPVCVTPVRSYALLRPNHRPYSMGPWCVVEDGNRAGLHKRKRGGVLTIYDSLLYSVQ